MIFSQSDVRWAHKLINGVAGHPLSRDGCAVTAIATAGALKGRQIDPGSLLELGNRNGCFLPGRAVVIWDRLARQIHMAMPTSRMVIVAKPEARGTLPGLHVEQLRAAIDGALDAGDFAVLGVDHDDDAPVDHYILAAKREAGGYLCADPATGNEVLINLDLQSPAGWAGKTYTVLSVKPIVDTA